MYRESYHGWLRDVSGTIIDKLEIVLSTMNDQLVQRRSAAAAAGERPRLLMLTGGLMRNHSTIEQIQANFENRKVEIHTHIHRQTDYGDK